MHLASNRNRKDAWWMYRIVTRHGKAKAVERLKRRIRTKAVRDQRLKNYLLEAHPQV
jgi:hypothetical protein